MKKVCSLFMLAALCVSALLPARVSGQKPVQKSDPADAAKTSTASPSEARYAPGEVIVQFKDGASEGEKADARNRVRASRKQGIRIRAAESWMPNNLEVDSVGEDVTVAEAVRAFKSHPAVEFAEPNWIYSRQTTSNDPIYTKGSLWGMYASTGNPANQFGSQASRAWGLGYVGSRNIIVGVIDEGIDPNHEDLAANIWTNPYEIPNNGVDDDGNGYVDDVNGWDFNGNDNSIYDGPVGDTTTDDHGTHVAGTIGAVGGNGKGVTGVNWSVTIISAKFMGPRGGSTANAIRAVDYLTNLKIRHPELNIVATNNSWGGGGYSQALHDAIIRAAKQNILFVAAAGNSSKNMDKRASYPACYDTSVGTTTQSAAGYDAVIAVAAIDANGQLASFSNYGSKSVDLAAPGASVNSTTPRNTYRTMSGTSMAAPHVTGAVALYASAYPWAAPWAIRNAVFSSAVWTSSLNGKVGTNGRLDAYGALTR